MVHISVRPKKARSPRLYPYFYHSQHLLTRLSHQQVHLFARLPIHSGYSATFTVKDHSLKTTYQDFLPLVAVTFFKSAGQEHCKTFAPHNVHMHPWLNNSKQKRNILPNWHPSQHQHQHTHQQTVWKCIPL